MSTAEAVQKLENEHHNVIVNKRTFHDQTTLEIAKGNLKLVIAFFKSEGYDVLMDLSAVDYLEPEKHTLVVYFLHNSSTYERVRISLSAARDETIPSVTDIWLGAQWYEREVYDLFGVNFEGHPTMKRILMPDDWQGHPLRKDFSLMEVPVQFKHGVSPKVPSEIIPHVKSYS